MLLTKEDFEAHAGALFAVDSDGGPVELRLERVEPIASPGVGQRESFRLEWRGPLEPVLDQATHNMRCGESVFEIFIVPIARDANGVRYEAIFS